MGTLVLSNLKPMHKPGLFYIELVVVFWGLELCWTLAKQVLGFCICFLIIT